MYQALYRKWRPKTFADVVGQQHITDTLQRQVAEGRLSHAYLFTGTRGTGKTTCAKILSKAVNCEHPVNGNPCNACPSCLGIESGSFLDVLELDAASNNGVDQVRALRDEAIYSPAQVKKRVYIVDEVHMLSIAAFNALLKILEEPPEHLMFILATTELHKVPATILSRCQRFAFRRLLPQDIDARLRYVAQQEGIELLPDAAELLSRLADGAMRDALSLLDQCAAAGGAIDAAAVLDALGLAGNLQTAQLMEHILHRDASAALTLLHSLHAGGRDVGAVLGELSALARDLLISITAPRGGAALLTGGYDETTMAALRALCTPARLIAITTTLQRANAELQWSMDRRTDAELCLLRLCDDALSGDLTALTARIERLEQQLKSGEPAAPAREAEKAPVSELPKAEAADDDPPPWDDGDAPPPYGEPIAPEPPRKAAAPAAAAASAPAAEGGDAGLFRRLTERYKNKLTADKRAFLGMADGVLDSGVLTVYCKNDLVRNVLDCPAVAAVLAEVTAAEAGCAVNVRFTEGEAPGAKPHDKMEDLLRMSNKFSGFTVK